MTDRQGPLFPHRDFPVESSVDLQGVCQALEFRYDQDAFKRVIYTESHDAVANGKTRIPQEVSAEVKLMKTCHLIRIR